MHTCDNERRSKGSLRKAEIYRTMSNGSVARVTIIDELKLEFAVGNLTTFGDLMKD